MTEPADFLEQLRQYLLDSTEGKTLGEILEENEGLKKKENWTENIIKKNIVQSLDDVLNLCRCLITKYKFIQWINPAAVIIPIRPEQLIGKKDIIWDDMLNFAFWLPTHKDANKQSKLISNYLATNYADVDKTQHISAQIVDTIKNGHSAGCFIAKLEKNKIQLSIKKCSSVSGQDPQSYSINFAGEHYTSLFDEIREILFLPHRSLSRQSTDGNMYQEHLVGCYLGINNRNCTDERCCFIPEELKELCDQLSLIMYAKARQKANKKLFDALQQQTKSLQKYESMYNQLLRPLRSLTEAVRKSQKEAHELTATIYDPLDFLLGRQPEIAQFFNEGDIHKGLFTITIKHQPNNYTSNEQCALAVELLYLLLPACLDDAIKKTIIMKENNDLNEANNIWKSACAWYQIQSNNSAKPYYTLCNALLKFFGGDDWHNLEPLDFLNRTKARFFTLYKPDEAYKAISWITIESYLKTIVYNNNFLNPTTQDLNDPQDEIVAEKANPFSTQGHFVDFVCRVVAQQFCHHEGNTGINCSRKEEDSNITFVLESTQEWFSCEDKIEFVIFLTQLKKNRDNNVRLLHEVGDRKRPFVDMFERIPYHLKPEIAPNNLQFTIGKVSFKFDGTMFEIKSRGTE